MTRLKDISQKLESPDESERQAGIIELVRLGDLRVVPVLKRIIGRDQNMKVRHSARKALTILQKHVNPELEKKSKKTKQINLNALQSMLYAQSEAKRCQGVDAAVKYNDPRAVKLLYKRLKTEESLKVTRSLLLGIAILGQQDSLKVLADYLSHKTSEIRCASAEALSYIKTESVVPYLLISFQDSDKKVRKETLSTINSLPAGVQVNAFKDILINREPRVKKKVLDVLYSLKKEYTVPMLAMALRDKDKAISARARALLEKLRAENFENAGRALKSIDDLKDAPPTKIISELRAAPKEELKNKKPVDKILILHKLINDNRKDRIADIHRILEKEKDSRVLSKAVVAAGILGTSQTIKLLLRFLEDPDDRIRANTVEAVFRIDSENYQNRLLDLLKDKNNRVRANAVMALYSSHKKEAGRTLRKMVSSSELKDRLSAIYVISDIMDESLCTLLESLLMDRVPEIRNRAADCLRIYSQKGISSAEDVLKSFEEKRSRAKESDSSFSNIVPGSSPLSSPVQQAEQKVPVSAFSINKCPKCGFENDGWRKNCRKCRTALKSGKGTLQNEQSAAEVRPDSMPAPKEASSLQKTFASAPKKYPSAPGFKGQVSSPGSHKSSMDPGMKKMSFSDAEKEFDKKGFIREFLEDLNNKSPMERLFITSLVMFILIYLPLLVIMLLQKYVFIS
jgi:HEAT repeat protein